MTTAVRRVHRQTPTLQKAPPSAARRGLLRVRPSWLTSALLLAPSGLASVIGRFYGLCFIATNASGAGQEPWGAKVPDTLQYPSGQLRRDALAAIRHPSRDRRRAVPRSPLAGPRLSRACASSHGLASCIHRPSGTDPTAAVGMAWCSPLASRFSASHLKNVRPARAGPRSWPTVLASAGRQLDRVGAPPGDAALRTNSFEVPDEQHAAVPGSLSVASCGAQSASTFASNIASSRRLFSAS